MSAAERLSAIRERVATSAERSGRAADAVTLVGVCKRQPYGRITPLVAAGLSDLGENTAQGLAETASKLAREHDHVQWHFVGALQRNKVNQVLPHEPLIHSIDRLSLARAVSKRAGEREVDVLVQVNVAREEQKSGVDPDQAVDLACTVASLPGLRLRGLMTLPPADEDPAPHFENLARLSEVLQQTSEGQGAAELSMGMSSDFETAIECGATIVRVGTALFGERDS